MSAMAAALGAIMVAWAVLGLMRDRPAPDDFGTTAQPAPIAPAAPRDRLPTPAHRASAPPASHHDVAAPPVRLSIPGIDLDATVRPVGAAAGSLAVPDDIGAVGWWDRGAMPGSGSGSVVLDGHVDSMAGPGALFRLTDLHAGDAISVVTASGRFGYTVTGRRVLAKDRGLPGDLFARAGAPRLVLITCGGPFDSATHSYQDNIVVFAAPA